MQDGSPIVQEFDSWLGRLVEGEASDLHVKVGSAPMLRAPHGLERLDREPLTASETRAIADGIIPEDRNALFVERGDVDFAYSVPNVGRFRANVFRQRGSLSMVLRKLRFGGPSFQEVGLPDSLAALADEHRGLILVTGPTGSGKTTTLYSALRMVQSDGVNIVTVEDPVEYRLGKGIVQVQVHEKAGLTFAAALRSILRQDPDVVLVGEVRDR